MTLILKDPGAVLDYAVDWGAEYLEDDAIAQSSWSVSPVEPGGVAIVGSRFDPRVASVAASGGLPGRSYRLINDVVLVTGRSDRRSVMLRVERR